MVKQLGNVGLGQASDFGAPDIGGVDPSVLSFPAFGSDQSVTIVPGGSVSGSTISSWALGLDFYIPQPSGSFTSLLQTGDGDGEVFLRDNGDGTAGIGISGVYDGSIAYDQWVRLVVTVTVESGDTVLRKYVDGSLVGEQNLGQTARWAIDPDTGLRLFTDNDGETAPGLVSSVFFTQEVPTPPEVLGILATVPTPDAAGFFPAAPSFSALEIDFTGEDIAPRYGDAAVILEGNGYRTPVDIGDSRIAFASQFGITGPGGEDVPVLDYAAYNPAEGILVSLPGGQGDLSTYTAVWDIRVDDVPFGWHALLQTDSSNSGDGELFIRGDRGLGINGDYDGTVPTDTWSRIVITVADQGDGTATLSKYIDGVFLDAQTVSADRFTLSGTDGFLILADESNETSTGYLAHFGLATRALSQSEVAALGTADGNGPFDPPAGTGDVLQLGFDGYAPASEFGFAGVGVTDESSLIEPEIPGPIKDMLVATGDDPVTFNLEDVFGAGTGNYAVTGSNGEAVAAVIENGVLTLSFGELGVSDLTITATDGLGRELTDDVRVRVAGEGAYTIAIMPDTQDYTSNGSITPTFAAMTQWMADNADNKKIGFVTHVGDITQTATPGQFQIALDAMNILRDAGIPFSVLPGNHDIGDGGSANVRTTGPYNDAFSPTYMSADPTFAGVYDQEPGRYDNNYHLWDAPDGTGWIILNLEFGPRDDVMRWADDVLTKHGDRKAMVLTHSYSNFDGRHDSLGAPLNAEGAGYDYGLTNDPRGTWDGETLWREALAKHPNVLFTAGGHIFGDGAETVISYNDFGNPVFQFLVNYQNGVSSEANGAGDPARGGNGGNGAIRLVTIDPANDAFYTETYFTELDEYFTGFRDKAELDRDGLTGPYVGHEEAYFNVEVGERSAEAIADAGDDQVVKADAGEKTAEVTLFAGDTNDPQGDITAYRWTDEDGRLLGEGETVQVSLGAGVHDLTLTVETARGVESRDDIRVIVETDDTWLVDTFNDGDAEGWGPPEGQEVSFTQIGTDLGFALPAISGAAQIPLTLSFDSHWRPEDFQTGQVLVSFDGGEPAELLLLDGTTTTDTDNRNIRIDLDFLAPASAETVEVFWRMSEAGNDWYWAIDNVELSGPGGSVLLAEDFNSLAGSLQPAVDENIDILGWTQTPPTDWTIETDPNTPPGTTEWRGWSFTNLEFWTSADGQARGEFTRADGVFAVADPDEWDDFNGGSESGTDYDTTLATPAVSLVPVGGGGSGGEAAGVLRVPALSPNQGLLVTPEAAGTFDEYTLIYDIYVADVQGTWTSFFQTDITNSGDGELYLANGGSGFGGIGISGAYDGPFTYDAWNRVAFTVSLDGDAQVLNKYINGALVGTQTVDSDVTDGTRWRIDADQGFLLFSDNDGETSEVFVNAFAFTSDVLSDADILALGAADVDGPLAEPQAADAFQFSFDGAPDALDFGQATLEEIRLGSDTGTPFFVKGSAASRAPGDGLDAPEGALFDQSNGEGNLILWEEGDWADLVLEATLKSLDDDTMGVAFRYQDADNHYLLTLDSQMNTRKLVRVEDGEETVLAEEGGGYRFYDEIDLKLSIEGGKIAVSLDGVPLFGGRVLDPAPLGAGTIGLYSSFQKSAIFDDIVVRAPKLDAEAGLDRVLIDFDGDGVETVGLDGNLSTGADGAAADWTGPAGDAGSGLATDTMAWAGRNVFALSLDDGSHSDTDEVVVTVASGDRLIAADQFEDGNYDGWRIVDTTEIGGPADWAVVDGALVEQSGAYSRELNWAGASNSDPWQRGWSPHGDGVAALHKGTYALWEGDETIDDYSIEAVVQVPTAGGVGFMMNWVDEDNYYKLEIDASANLITLVKVVEGYETYLARVRTVYTPDDEFHLKAERVDGKMQAWIDGHEIFAYDLEDHDLGEGAAGVYAWGAAGARFDDVAIVDLSTPFEDAVPPPSAIAPEMPDWFLEFVTVNGIDDDLLDADAWRDDGLGTQLRKMEASIEDIAADFGVWRPHSADVVLGQYESHGWWRSYIDSGRSGFDLIIGDGPDADEGRADRDRIDGSKFNGDDVIFGDNWERWTDAANSDIGKSDVITADSGDDVVFGQGGNDRLYGERGDDQLFGGGGSDLLVGGWGNDLMSGGDGNDWLRADRGKDVLEGGDGLDKFDFSRDGGVDGHHVITDYSAEDGDLIIVEKRWGWRYDSVDDLTIQQDGFDTVITFDHPWDTGSVRLQNFTDTDAILFDFGGW